MTNKPTDAEIIKALECCTSYDCEHCKFVPSEDIHKSTLMCNDALMKTALDLINRLKAENERLKREIEDLESIQEITPEAKYLIDTKADKVISCMNEILKSQDQIKNEAIKEFADKVIDLVYESDSTNPVSEWQIRDLVKEMVGDTDATN